MLGLGKKLGAPRLYTSSSRGGIRWSPPSMLGGLHCVPRFFPSLPLVFHMHSLTSLSRFAPAAAMALCGVLMFSAASCNIVGPAYVLIHGPEKRPAEFELDSQRPVVVFIDDRGSRLDRRPLRNTVARTASDALLKSKTVKTAIDPASALIRVSGEQPSAPTDLTSLGTSVGAEVLIFATVDEFTLSRDGTTFQPTAVVRVKVIDCINRPSRLWPDSSTPEGYPLEVVLPFKQGVAPSNGAEYVKAQENLAIALGERLAKLFYSHEVNSRVSDLNDRK